MSRAHRALFASVRSEGGLLPSTLLERLSNGDRTLGGTDPSSYHLEPGERINEAASRAWTRLLPAWRGFREACSKLPEKDAGTTITRERWLLPLFQELGYGRLQPNRGAIDIEGRSFPISHKWGACPIHLVGFRTELDRRTPGVAGAARSSPHSLAQEYLNKVEESLWGYVSNGLLLRILRDNVSLTRQSFIEFDLEAMMEGEAYSDFVLLWMVTHQSRVEAEKAHECWLEKWSREAADQGTRALDRLRGGVEEAIRALGRGFLSHPANGALREQLRSGALSKEDYYRQILRLVYRLLFLFVAEDRGLLLDPKAGVAEQDRYLRFYSTGRLRRLAERRRGSPHVDLYRGLRLVMERLGDAEGCPSLGLPPLGSFLWSTEAIECLASSEIANRDLMEAVRALAFAERERRFWPVDYRNLGAEELGSVYESLLELHPDVDTGAGTFELRTAAGSERKTTGSYYTPSSLIACLLDSALDPVLEEAASAADPERAILDLKVCDPACGSGHFLIAAAHRLAKRLAAVRTGDEEPSPDATRTALRDVIGHCIYGVDLNPMAVELCKVNLWMEALEPGKPLSFLDHRIQCGNSLLGTTPALMAAGIPDEAFTAIEGDDKEIVAAAKKKNKAENKGRQIDMMLPLAAEPRGEYLTLSDGVQNLDRMDDGTIGGIRQKEATYRRLSESTEYRRARRAADAWCAAFVWRKVKGGLPVVTTDALLRIETNPTAVPGAILEEVERLADHYGLFHWHLAFPDVFRLPANVRAAEDEACGWSGGFDVALGNPPWDTLSPDTKEFFSIHDPGVRFLDLAAQSRRIDELRRDPDIRRTWEQYSRDLYAQVHFFRNSTRYRLFAPGNLGKGDFNSYRMFVETALQITKVGGRLAQIVPENLYNGANAMAIRKALFEECDLRVLLGFENTKEVWFKGIDSRSKFCLYVAQKGRKTEAFGSAFNVRSEQQLHAIRGGDGLAIPPSLVAEFSPDALAVMEFSSQIEIDIAKKMYARWPKFGDEAAGPPYRQYMAEVHMGNDRDLFDEDPKGYPVYEGRMVGQYDHRAKGYVSGRGRAAEWVEWEFGDPAKAIRSQWHIAEDRLPDKVKDRVARYRIGFCDVASPTNERSLVAALLPLRCVSGDKVPTIVFGHELDWAYMVWLAIANSYAMDFIARKKVSLKMSYTLLDSLPFPRLSCDDPVAQRLVTLATQLSCVGPEMCSFWDRMASDGYVPQVPDPSGAPGLVAAEARFLARAEIEAVVALHLFGLTREELAFILDTFPIVKRRDEAAHGEYRTKRVILEIYDEIAEAMRSGKPDQLHVRERR